MASLQSMRLLDVDKVSNLQGALITNVGIRNRFRGGYYRNWLMGHGDLGLRDLRLVVSKRSRVPLSARDCVKQWCDVVSHALAVGADTSTRSFSTARGVICSAMGRATLAAVSSASTGRVEQGDAEAMHTEMALLRMENVTKSYDGRKVVNEISMSVRQGEIVGLLGPNGAGKSTTFNLMVGRERPSEGSIYLRSADITMLSLSHRARLGIGYLTQEPSVFRGLSVHDNIRLVLQETGVPRAQHAEKVHELLEMFSLHSVEHTIGKALSGGERRRTELARALASNCSGKPPSILLVDEPFAGVDPIGIAKIQNQLRHLCNENDMGILITDHNVNETLRICDRAYMVYNGCVMASGGPEELYQDLCVQKHYLGEGFQRW